MSVPKVNLELQMKFLDQLHNAVSKALDRFGDKGPDKLAELEYVSKEVMRARRIVGSRIDDQPKATGSQDVKEAPGPSQAAL